jgi:hypothetical protein
MTSIKIISPAAALSRSPRQLRGRRPGLFRDRRWVAWRLLGSTDDPTGGGRWTPGRSHRRHRDRQRSLVRVKNGPHQRSSPRGSRRLWSGVGLSHTLGWWWIRLAVISGRSTKMFVRHLVVVLRSDLHAMPEPSRHYVRRVSLIE